MAGGNRRKCKCCRTLFRPDPRNRHHQRYCSAHAAPSGRAGGGDRSATRRGPHQPLVGRRRRLGAVRHGEAGETQPAWRGECPPFGRAVLVFLAPDQ
jgi:hypothetical protein